MMMALTNHTSFNEQEIVVKNTFIQLTSTSPRRPILRRSLTDSALCCALSSERSWIASDGVDSEASTASIAQADDFTTDTESDDDGQYSSTPCSEALTKYTPSGVMDECSTDTERDHDDQCWNAQWSSESLFVTFDFVFPIPCLQQPLVAPKYASFDGEVDDDRTTVMLCNLPIEFTPAMLLEQLDSMSLGGMYDFIYMPIDFRSGWWRGFAFINCVSHTAALHFRSCLKGFCKWPFPCKKICECKWSDKQQGREANVEHFRNNSIMHYSVPPEWKPLLFENGVQVEFPLPTQCVKAPRFW
jgi:hypothetical protein